MKKILQSISLLLLLLTISSDLLAQTYERSTGGFWNNAAQWTPSDKGVPNGDGVQVTLNNAATKLPDLNLGGKSYHITKLNVPDKANRWQLSSGELVFHKAGDNLAEINYGGEEILVFQTRLNLQSDTKLNVSNELADVGLGDPISGSGKLLKFGPGALLIEQPSDTSIEIYQGIIGIGKQYYQKVKSNLIIAKDSEVRLFAIDDNINITKLKLLPKTTLNLIDNPYPTKPTHDITLGKDLYGPRDSTINQLSHGALIFEGIDRFYGTIKSQPKSGPIIIDGHTHADIETQPGAGPIMLNGSTDGNIEINGSTIEGTGEGGNLTATNGAIISPGYNDSFGKLSFENVKLDPSTILNFDFSNKTNENIPTIGEMLKEAGRDVPKRVKLNIDTDAASGDLIQVKRDLILGGKLDIHADTASRLENGTYPLFKYSGELINNGLVISSVPPGYDASNFTVITRIPGQILLGVGPPDTIHLWNGGHTKNGIIQGGNGTWSDAGLNFTDPTGTQSETGGGNTTVDVFGGNPGEVGVQGPVHVHEIQILTNNYTFYPLNKGSWFLANGSITIEVGSTYQVNISVPFTGGQTGPIIKDGDGILILSGDNRNVGSFVLNGGTLVADTLNALPNSVTLKDGLMRFGMTHILQVGSYTQHEDTILALRASRTNHDLLVVNGPANLGGTLLLLQEGKGKSSSLGRQITLITTQGLNGSRFDNIQLAHTSLEKLSVNYDANNVYVISHFDPIYPYAISHNAQALARNLDLFSNTDRNQSLFDSLAALSLPQVPAALEKLVPSQVSALSSIGLSVNRSQMRSLQGRLDDLNSGYASYGELNTSAPKQYGLSLAGISTQTNFLMNEDQDLWNFYMRGNGSFGRQSQDNENEMPGYDYGQGGTFIGADHPLNEKVYVGGAVSYTYTDASFHDDRGSLSTNSYFAHLYAAYAQPKGFNLISSLSLGDHEFDLRRRALTDTAHSQPQSREVDFQSQISYNIPLKPNLTVSPYAGLAYSAFWMNGFQEYNSEANLKINNDQTNWLRSTVGAKVQYEKSFTKGIRKASVETNLAWEHEYFNAQSRGIDAEWVGGGVPSFHVQGGRIAPDTLISGVNLRLAVTNLFSVITGYDIEANRDYISHNFNVGASLTF